jgi:hypothetical protein
MKVSASDLSSLRPGEIEPIVADLLRENGDFDSYVLSPPNDTFDIEGFRQESNTRIAVEVKGSRRIPDDHITPYYFASKKSGNRYGKFIFVCLYDIANKAHIISVSGSTGDDFVIYDKSDVLRMVEGSRSLGERFSEISKRRIFIYVVGIVAGLLSALFIYMASMDIVATEKMKMEMVSVSLSKDLQSVNTALESISDLEKSLQSVRETIENRRSEISRISVEYSKAKELERLTDIQRDELKSLLASQSTWDQIKSYGLGFLIGVAGSILANAICETWFGRSFIGLFRPKNKSPPVA